MKSNWPFYAWIVLLLISGCVAVPVEPDPVMPTVRVPALPSPSRPPATATPRPPPPPTATPAPTLRRLTEAGCCTGPSWSTDGRQVIFVDKPSAAAPAGFYAVAVDEPAAKPQLLTDRMLIYSPDFQAAAYPQGEAAVIERLDTGATWQFNTRGNPPALSPDKSMAVWEDTADYGAYNVRRTEVWLARLDSARPKPQSILTLHGGGLVAWFPDSTRLLIAARPALTTEQRALVAFTIANGAQVELARADRISGITLSPGGMWVAYFVSFAANAAENGLWVVRTDGTARRKLDWFGSYQWRDEQCLLVIPLELDTPGHTIWQVEAASGAAVRLVDPVVTPFTIANGDWRVAPGGRQMVFVNALDKALWLLEFNRP